jgi:hypothetical protein
VRLDIAGEKKGILLVIEVDGTIILKFLMEN